MTKIIWKTKKDEHVTKLVSEDGRWHLSGTKENGGEAQLFLSNHDILTGPCAFGSGIEECLRNFIVDCSRLALKLADVKAEAEDKLAELTNKR